MLKSYKLFENVEQAKKFFKDNNIDLDKKPYVKKEFEDIKKLLGNNLYYLGLFTKFHFGPERIPLSMGETNDKFFESLIGLFNFIKKHKNLNDYLPKNIIDYNTFEELSDDIRIAQDDIIVNDFYKNIYSSLRKDINIKDQNVKDTILKYVNLPDETKKGMTPLVDYKNQGKSGKEYINDLNNFVNKLGHDREYILDEIKKYGDKVQIVYDKNNILVIRTFDKSAIKEFGSDRWCIVYAQDSYYYNYCNPLNNMTQYIIFNFNKPSTDANSLYGVSINSSGTTPYGASQNRANVNVHLREIIDSLNLPDDVLVSYTFPKELIKKMIDPKEVITSGHGKDYYTDEEIQNMNFDFDFKFQNKLLSDKEYQKLELLKKYLYNDNQLNSEEIEELKSLPIDKKLGTNWTMVKRYKALSAEEYNINLNLYKKNEYRKGEFDEKELEELRKLPYTVKKENWKITKYLKLLTDKEYDNLSWDNKWEYNNSSFTEKDYKKLNSMPFAKKLKIASNGFIDEIMKPEDFESSDFNDLKFDLMSDSIELTTTDEPYAIMQIVGLDDMEFWEFAYDRDDNYKDMYGEENYIGHYLDDETLKTIKELMDVLGYNFDGEITDEGVIANFMEEYKDYMVYETNTFSGNNIQTFDISDLCNEVGMGIDMEYNELKNKVEAILPYGIQSDRLILDSDYIIKLLENNEEINNIDDLLNAIDDVHTVVDEYNKQIDRDKKDKNEKINYYNLTKDDVGVEPQTLESIDKNFKKIIEYNEDNPVTKDFRKNRDLLYKLGFKGTNTVKRGNVEIRIDDRNLKDGKVKIMRSAETDKGYNIDKGWVKIKNLDQHFSKNLFESRKVIDFQSFINK